MGQFTNGEVLISEEEILEEFKREVGQEPLKVISYRLRKDGKQPSLGYLSEYLNGKRKPNKFILDFLGITKEVLYVR